MTMLMSTIFRGVHYRCDVDCNLHLQCSAPRTPISSTMGAKSNTAAQAADQPTTDNQPHRRSVPGYRWKSFSLLGALACSAAVRGARAAPARVRRAARPLCAS